MCAADSSIYTYIGRVYVCYCVRYFMYLLLYMSSCCALDWDLRFECFILQYCESLYYDVVVVVLQVCTFVSVFVRNVSLCH